jgi:hypothetical protein
MECPKSSRTSAHFWLSCETPSVPANLVDTKPILRDAIIIREEKTTSLLNIAGVYNISTNHVNHYNQSVECVSNSSTTSIDTVSIQQ